MSAGRSSVTERSEALHLRVRELARRALEQAPGTEAPGFEPLALDIARFQAEHNPVVSRLCRQHGGRFERLEQVPAVPADAFRRGRVAVHPPCDDVACFVTSGTTGGAGRHVFRTLETYAELCVRWGARALLGGDRRVTALALAPPFEPERCSSLGYMMQRFMQHLDGRGLGDGPFEACEPGRFLLTGEAVDVQALRRGAALAAARGEPLLLLATSFALVWLLDVLGGEQLPLPVGSVVMLTGGFKGRARSIAEAELGAALERALGVPPERLIGEYGMTELGSQLYDRGLGQGPEGQSVFVAPPWLRVTPVDPLTFAPVPPGEVGLARFTDLVNVDSAVTVLTRDRVRRVSGGIVLLGRQPGAPLRGCSLAIEPLAGWHGPGRGA